jgi:hypothetical protein
VESRAGALSQHARPSARASCIACGSTRGAKKRIARSELNPNSPLNLSPCPNCTALAAPRAHPHATSATRARTSPAPGCTCARRRAETQPQCARSTLLGMLRVTPLPYPRVQARLQTHLQESRLIPSASPKTQAFSKNSPDSSQTHPRLIPVPVPDSSQTPDSSQELSKHVSKSPDSSQTHLQTHLQAFVPFAPSPLKRGTLLSR